MCIVAVYTAIGKKSPQMKVGIVLLAVLNRLKHCFVLEEIAILDCLCDRCQILINNSSGANIHMTNLRVTHLSVWKSNCKSGSISSYIWTLCHQLIHHRCVCHVNCITFCLVCNAIAIKYHQYNWFLTHCLSPLYYNNLFFVISCLIIYSYTLFFKILS